MKTAMLLVAILCTVSLAYAEPVVTHSGETYLSCREIGNSTVWLIDHNDVTTSKPGFLFAPNGCENVLPGVPTRYRKVVGGLVIEMTQVEKDVLDQAAADASELATRENAKSNIDGFISNPLFRRALAEIIRKEINILRSEHSFADRTLSQLKTQIKAEIDSGNVD